MKTPHWLTTFALLITVAACSRPGSAQTLVGVDAFVGTWRNTARDGGEAHIAEQVEAGIGPMRLVRRNVARRRILASNPPVRRVVIGRGGQEVRVEFVGARTYAAPLGGATREGRGPDNSNVDVSFRMRGARLHERIQAGQGYSANVYSLSQGGQRLTLRSTIHSSHLPGPITYTLRFRRQ